MFLLRCFQGLPDKLPDLIIAFFPEAKDWQFLSRYIQAIKTVCPGMPVIVLSQASAESKCFEELTEVADQVLKFPPDSKELAAAIQSLTSVSRLDKWRQHQIDKEKAIKEIGDRLGPI